MSLKGLLRNSESCSPTHTRLAGAIGEAQAFYMAFARIMGGWKMTENADVFGAKEKLLGELGWQENQFVKDLRIYDRESFLRYYCPLDGGKVLERLAFDAKACMRSEEHTSELQSQF